MIVYHFEVMFLLFQLSLPLSTLSKILSFIFKLEISCHLSFENIGLVLKINIIIRKYYRKFQFCKKQQQQQQQQKWGKILKVSPKFQTVNGTTCFKSERK